MSAPEIRLYDTLSREKRPLEPLATPGRVGVYVCGPTVYDRAHIGNARPVVVFDVLVRLLRHAYGADAVTYVRNITDVDDKITTRARATLGGGEAMNDAIARITSETIAWFHEDIAALGVAPPDHEPRATGYIGEMIGMIETLIASGHAYAAEGHALFAVGSDPRYGELAKRSLDEMRAGARVEVAPYKRDPMDFVLWKPSADDEPGWDNPPSVGPGLGRPGWHIECSAMSAKLLGHTFDIHGGGVDLAFPHHENERAQSLCANPGSDFARLWMHNGFVQVDGEKMSKSLGNFLTVADLKDAYPGEAIRYALLTTQYRQPFDWTDALAEDAKRCMGRWRALTDDVEAAEAPPEAVVAALSDDLNTPKAIAEMHALAGKKDGPALKAAAQLVGLLTPELAGWTDTPKAGADVAARIDGLLAERAAARKDKDFARADAIRAVLDGAGVVVIDTPGGVEWRTSESFDAAKLEDGA